MHILTKRQIRFYTQEQMQLFTKCCPSPKSNYSSKDCASNANNKIQMNDQWELIAINVYLYLSSSLDRRFRLRRLFEGLVSTLDDVLVALRNTGVYASLLSLTVTPGERLRLVRRHGNVLGTSRRRMICLQRSQPRLQVES